MYNVLLITFYSSYINTYLQRDIKELTQVADEMAFYTILTSSYVVALVQPYHNNVLKRVVKSPLLHFLDTGLCAYLLKWGNGETLERGAMSGAFFESWVFSEIDILFMENGTLYPIEIKKSASPGTGAAKHFKVFNPVTEPERFGDLVQYKTDIGEGAVICMTNNLLPIDEKNWYVPAWMI